MLCFLCGEYYEPEMRKPVVDITTDDGETVAVCNVVDKDGRVFRLCPSCVKAAVFGNMMAGGGLLWNGEIRYEDDDNR